MAINTICRQVRACQRETGVVVIKCITCVPGGVAGEASGAVVYISVNPVVLIICFRVGMAGRAGELRKVGRVGMAIEALIPFSLMFTTVNWEILTIVVKGGGHPSRFAVATGAVCWELCRSMVGVGRLIIVADMAARTSIWRVGIIPVVAGSAIVSNGGMCAVQGIIIVVNGKGSGLPTGGGVTGFAIRRDGERGMVWIRACVVIRRMATRAGIRRVHVIAVVTDITIIRDGSMRPRKRIKTIVVKCRRYPGCFAVTSGAIRRELLGDVVGISRLVVIRCMAACAGVRRRIVISVVAGGAIVRNGGMRAVQRVIIVVNGKGCGFPTGGGVAGGAIRRDGERGMIRIGALVVIRRMTARASVRRVGVIAVVTGVAVVCDGRMRPRERVKTVVVEVRRRPGCLAVTGGAIRGELYCGVVRGGGLIVIVNMTACASIRCVGIVPVVAGYAIVRNGGMRAVQRVKTVVVKRRRRPGGFAVTGGAIGWELLGDMVRISRLVVIGRMTACTGIRRRIVIAVVAGGAIVRNGGMRAVQGVIIVVNGKGGGFPTGSGMAGFAIRRDGQSYVVRVGALVVIRRMTARASVRGIGVIAVVTGVTVVCDSGMRACERVKTVVVEVRRRPGCLAVTGGAIRGELRCGVVRGGGLIVVVNMTACASIRRVGVVPVVAGSAIVRNGGVCTVQRVKTVVVKRRWRPGGFAVAGGAIRGELLGNVVRISRLVIIGCMTAGTGIRRRIVIAVVAGDAIVRNGGMRAVQRVIIVVNGKGGGFPAGGGMAGGAIRRDGECGMVRIGALVVIRRMATRTIGRRTGIAGSMAVEAGGR